MHQLQPAIWLLAARETPHHGLEPVLLIAGLLILVRGFAHALVIMQRPQTHSLCVASLAALLLSSCSLFAIALIDHYVSLPPALRAGLGVISLFGLAITIVLAIVGLVDLRKNSSQYNQGRRQAWAALLAAMAPIGLVTLIAGLAASRLPTTTAINSGNKLKGLANVGAPATGRQSGADKDAEQFADLNFQFQRPDKTWIHLHAPAINSAASLAYACGKPQTLFVVLAERMGAEMRLTDEVILDLVKFNALRTTDSVVFGPSRRRTVAGVEGLSIEAEMQKDGRWHRMIVWCGARGGFIYQLTAFCELDHSSELVTRPSL